jgi:hypothetical protein
MFYAQQKLDSKSEWSLSDQFNIGPRRRDQNLKFMRSYEATLEEAILN